MTFSALTGYEPPDCEEILPMNTQYLSFSTRNVSLVVGFLLGLLLVSPTMTFANEVTASNDATTESVVVSNSESKGSQRAEIQDQIEAITENNIALAPPSELRSTALRQQSTSVITVLIVVVVALSVIVLTMIVLTVWLYQWRIKFRDTEGRSFRTVVPERFINWLHEQSDRIKESIKHQAAAAEDVRTLRTSFAGLQESTLGETKKIRDMLEIHRSLLEEKDEEIKRLKSLYETAVFHRFVRRFVEVDRFITDVLKAGDVRSDDLEKTQHFLRGALDECHVEMFADEVIGKPFRELGELVEDNPEQESTHNPNEHGLVSRVIEAGYRLQLLEDPAVVRPARVIVFQAIEQPGH